MLGGGELGMVIGRTTYLIDRRRPFYKGPPDVNTFRIRHRHEPERDWERHLVMPTMYPEQISRGHGEVQTVFWGENCTRGTWQWDSTQSGNALIPMGGCRVSQRRYADE